jgi:hypothetical protein
MIIRPEQTLVVRFRQSLIVNGHNYVEGNIATLPDGQARRLIHAGAVEAHTPEAKREAALVPKTRKAAKDV